MPLGCVPGYRLSVIVDLVHYIQHQREQRHPYQYAIVGLSEDRQIRVLIQIIIQLLRLGPRISGTVFGSQCSV